MSIVDLEIELMSSECGSGFLLLVRAGARLGGFLSNTNMLGPMGNHNLFVAWFLPAYLANSSRVL